MEVYCIKNKINIILFIIIVYVLIVFLIVIVILFDKEDGYVIVGFGGNVNILDNRVYCN